MNILKEWIHSHHHLLRALLFIRHHRLQGKFQKCIIIRATHVKDNEDHFNTYHYSYWTFSCHYL